MKKYSFLLMVFGFGLAVLWSCKKEDVPTVSGSASEPGFTYSISRGPGGDTLPFASTVTFTNTSTDAFAYYWDFGDATVSTDANPVKTYTVAKVYDVKLTSVGKAGHASTLQHIALDNPCDFAPFSTLTGCASRHWQLSPLADAITIYNTDGTVAYSGAPAECQSDDEYTFFSDGTFGYNSKGQTFVANEGPAPYSCQAPAQNAGRYYLLKNEGGNPKIVLSGKDVNRNPFIGTTDSVVDNTYEILSVTDSDLRIQGTLPNGQKLALKLINGFDISSIKLYLTGGSRRTWRLDSTGGANAVIAGLEDNPAQYYSGGPLASCQKNDWYTFTQTDSVYLNTNGDALQPTQGYICNFQPNYAVTYTFGPVQGSVAGLAQISLAANNPAQWIGVLDRGPENVYRIISISNDALVLRSGNGSGTVHEFKFVRK